MADEVTREPGFYWVQLPVGPPQIARWFASVEMWCIAGSEFDYTDSEVKVLSPRLERPPECPEHGAIVPTQEGACPACWRGEPPK